MESMGLPWIPVDSMDSSGFHGFQWIPWIPVDSMDSMEFHNSKIPKVL
jgi:hypothetical protein